MVSQAGSTPVDPIGEVVKESVSKIEICIRAQQGWSYAELGREFNRSRERIRAIVAKGRKYWYEHEQDLRGRPRLPELPEEYLEELKRVARRG